MEEEKEEQEEGVEEEETLNINLQTHPLLCYSPPLLRHTVQPVASA